MINEINVAYSFVTQRPAVVDQSLLNFKSDLRWLSAPRQRWGQINSIFFLILQKSQVFNKNN
jgi:hypothetical protein